MRNTGGDARLNPFTRGTFAGLTVPGGRRIGQHRIVDSSIELQCEDVEADPETTDHFIYRMNFGVTPGTEKLKKVTRRHHVAYDDEEGHYYSVFINKVGNSYYCFVDPYTYEDRDNFDTWNQPRGKSIDIDLCATALDRDPVTGTVYGCLYTADGTGYRWGTVNYATLAANGITELSEPLHAVACDLNGQYYAINPTGTFYKVDKATGALTEVGSTGLNLQYSTGGCINNQNKTMIVSYSNDAASGIAEVDLATAATTNLVTFDRHRQLTCLRIASSQAIGNAPGIPALTAECHEGSMDAILTLTAPPRCTTVLPWPTVPLSATP